MDASELLKDGKIAPNTAKALGALPEADKQAFVSLFSRVKITVTQQAEFLEWLTDLSAKESKPVSAILAEAGVEAILAGEKLNSHQKREKIRDAVFNRRFPMVSARLARLRSATEALKPPSGVRLIPVSPLEDNEYRLEITFDSRDALKERLEALKSFTSRPEFIKFTDLISEKKEEK
jgi:hypothetical protein